MKIFLFHKPKQTIVNILFIAGVVCIFISIFAVMVTVTWNSNPQSLGKIEKTLFGFYGKGIEKLHAKALAETEYSKQFKLCRQLYKELENISVLNRYYGYRQEVSTFLIDYYIKKSDPKKAFDIVEKWEKEYPSDFIAKFKHIEVLSKTDSNQTTLYYSKLYKRYPDISEVREGYIAYLINDEKYNKALSVSADEYAKTEEDIPFQLFYIDNKNDFTQSQSVTYGKRDYTVSKGIYKVVFSERLEKLRGIRFDIDSNDRNIIISGMKILLNMQGKKRYLDIARLNQLARSKGDRQSFRINGGDPFFVFAIPDDMVEKGGEVKITVSFRISRINSAIDRVLKNKMWRVAVFDANDDQNRTMHFSLSSDGNKFISELDMKRKNVKSFKIHFPFFYGLGLDYFHLFINERKNEKQRTYSYHAIKTEGNGDLLIAGNNPYIEIDLNNPVDVEHIKMEFKFKDVTDE